MIGPDREEQLHEGFVPVSCAECGTTVKVRKSSPSQTSVQWLDTGEVCPHLTSARRGRPGALVERCPALSETIRAAVAAGIVPPGVT